jgi:hypothetical protein
MPAYKVTREYYVVGDYGFRREFDEMSDALTYLYSIIHAQNFHYLSIHRVTEYDAPQDHRGLFVANNVTTTVTIQGPASLYADPRLSRYHPINGWVVPETIEVEDASVEPTE